jgi:hypothetical protein
VRDGGRDGGTPDARPPDSGSPSDGGGDAGSLPDAGLPTFETPILIAELSTVTVDDPTLRADLLEIYFNRGSDIYTSTRSAPGRAWADPTPVDELNSAGTDTSPELSPDGLTIYFASARSGSLDIWSSTRMTVTERWSAPARVPELSSSMLDTNPTISADGLRLVLSRGASSSAREIYESRRGTPTEPWETPMLRPELSATRNDAGPMLASGGTSIVYFSDAPGGAGDSRSLFFARRRALDGPFDAPARIDELDSDGDEEDPWISEDESYMVFTRDGALYETRR